MKLTNKRLLIPIIALTFVFAIITLLSVRTTFGKTQIDKRFDYKYYADTYSDLKTAFGYDESKLWQHYVEFGQFEKRKCFDGDEGGTITVTTSKTEKELKKSFDYKFYADTYPDLKAAFGYNEKKLWNHYITYGIKEGRVCSASQQTSGNTTQSTTSTSTTATTTTSNDEFANEMLAKVNALRREQGVGELTLDEKCKNVSAIRVVEISSLYSHTRPDGRKSSTTWDDLGYQWSGVGENIAKIGDYYNTTNSLTQRADEFYDLFKNSPSHYSSMINSKWKKAYFNIYITYEEDGETVYHCVQTFSK